jgi:predicted dithiol-disulfide oxidoreductase (DUF899 family)
VIRRYRFCLEPAIAKKKGKGIPDEAQSRAPVLSTYALQDRTVYLTYSTTARGLEFLMGYYGFLDRTPPGRNEGDPPQLWIRRHDDYHDANPTSQ